MFPSNLRNFCFDKHSVHSLFYQSKQDEIGVFFFFNLTKYLIRHITLGTIQSPAYTETHVQEDSHSFSTALFSPLPTSTCACRQYKGSSNVLPLLRQVSLGPQYKELLLSYKGTLNLGRRNIHTSPLPM